MLHLIYLNNRLKLVNHEDVLGRIIKRVTSIETRLSLRKYSLCMQTKMLRRRGMDCKSVLTESIGQSQTKSG